MHPEHLTGWMMSHTHSLLGRVFKGILQDNTVTGNAVMPTDFLLHLFLSANALNLPQARAYTNPSTQLSKCKFALAKFSNVHYLKTLPKFKTKLNLTAAGMESYATRLPLRCLSKIKRSFYRWKEKQVGVSGSENSEQAGLVLSTG